MIVDLILILLVLFSGFYVQNNTTVEWKYSDGQPGGIYAGGFVSCDDVLYSIGGSSSSGPIRNNYQYDPATNQWTKKASLQVAHKNAAYVSTNGKIHVIAGDPFLDVHEVYDPIKDEWTRLASIPTKVQHVMGVTVNDKIYVMGGLETWNDISTKNQVYDIKTDSWIEMAPMPIGKHGYSSIVHNDKIYVFGSLANEPTGEKGIYGSNPSIDIYDTITDTWESIGNMPTDLYLGAIVVYGDEVIIIGGFKEADKPKASVDIFSLETHTWSEGLPVPEAFVGMGAVVYNDQLYVSGGAKPSNSWTTNRKLYHIPIKALLENID
jgi:N-acetylneuraminic acid mutarotase